MTKRRVTILVEHTVRYSQAGIILGVYATLEAASDAQEKAAASSNNPGASFSISEYEVKDA